MNAIATRLNLFDALPSTESILLHSLFVFKTFKSGDYIMRYGEESRSLYVLIDGKVSVSRATSDGRTFVLATLFPGEILGEIAALTSLPRTADVIATSDVRVAELSLNDLRNYLPMLPTLVFHLFKTMGQRLADSSAQVFILGTQDLSSRVLNTLQSLGAHSTKEDSGYVVLDKDLTQSEIARRVGATREAVNRTLQKLRRSGEVRVQDHSLLVRRPGSSVPA
jgi:CRP/FNR family cyclic AMP-dependent transcriptional regulator